MAQGVPGRLRPRIILTFGTTRVVGRQPQAPAAFIPRRNPRYSLSEAESTSGHMVLSGVPRKRSPVTPPGIDPGTVRLVAQCLNHYATPGPYIICVCVCVCVRSFIARACICDMYILVYVGICVYVSACMYAVFRVV